MFRRQTRGEAVFQVIDYVLLIVFSSIILIPLWTVVMNSFVSQAEISRRGMFILFPEKWDYAAYRLLLGSKSNIINGYKNTVIIVVIGTSLNLAFTIPMAYALSKKRLKGRTAVLGMVFVSMIFNGGMVPNFMLVKYSGMLDTLWALMIPGLVNSWNMLIMRNFFYAIPDDLEEAAYLDGANPGQILIRVVIPLSLPAITTIGLFYAVGIWNSWFNAVLYIIDSRKLPMQNIMRNIVASTSATSLQDVDSSVYTELDSPPPSQAMKSATIIVGTVPILLIYPFIQKYFVKGVMVGSIKG